MDPVNGNINFSNGNGTNTGSLATFICDPGYELIGDGLVVCNISGQWSGPTPTCRGKDNTLGIALHFQ